MLKVGGAAVAVAALSLGFAVPASADIAPSSTDVVGVGSDTVQNIANFLADGDPSVASSGINSTVSKNRLFSFDATPDANDRAGYLNGSASGTVGTPPVSLLKPLTPTIVLRAGSSPVLRPNGSGSGIAALLADPTGTSINYVRSSRLPTSPELTAANAGVNGLHVIKIATDALKVAAANITNAPLTLSAVQLVGIYECTTTDWGTVGGTAGQVPIPLIPQTGSGTRNTFLADLQTAKGATPLALGTCVQTVEENDPAAITAATTQATPPVLSPANAIAPFSEGRNNLYASGYFHNPAVAFPGGVALTSGITMKGGYVNTRGLFIAFRDRDKTSATPWQPGATQNWVQALFLNPAGIPFVNSTDGKAAIAAGGSTPAYTDCGAGAAVLTTC
jgi:ABC-type phosphate transport system substrate-binding protein